MKLFNHTPFRHAWARGTVNRPNDVLTMIVKGTFRTRHDEPAIVLPRFEQDHPRLRRPYPDGAHASCFYPGDFATFKPLADAVVIGTCHTPGGEPMPRCDVAFTLGNHRKVLAVFGDRYWHEDADGTWRMSEPEPFTAMPLRYENSFGGVDYIHNPLGKGRHNVWDLHPDGRIPLPNLENPEQLIADIEDAPPVAGYAPLGERTPMRQEKMGSMDVAWARREMPRKPVDFDWTSYNAAPEDQQFEGWFHGDEVLAFDNMHPVHNPYRVVLPGLRLRLFLNHIEPNGDLTFVEPGENLDTAWVNLDTERLALVWRAVTPVQGFEYRREIAHVLIVTERVEDPPLSPEHYREMMRWEVEPPDSPEVVEARAELAANLEKAKEKVADLHLPPEAEAELRAEPDALRFLELTAKRMLETLGIASPPSPDFLAFMEQAKQEGGLPPETEWPQAMHDMLRRLRERRP